MKLKLAKYFYIISSALIIAIGLIFLLFPEASQIVISRVVGAILAFTGLAKIFGYFSDSFYNIAFQFDFGLGLLTAAIGAVFILFPTLIVAYISVILSIFVIVNAVFTIQNALEAKKFGISRWWVMTVGAVPAIIIGIISLFHPFDTGILLTAFLGIAMILDGTENLIVAVTVIKTKNKIRTQEII